MSLLQETRNSVYHYFNQQSPALFNKQQNPDASSLEKSVQLGLANFLRSTISNTAIQTEAYYPNQEKSDIALARNSELVFIELKTFLDTSTGIWAKAEADVQKIRAQRLNLIQASQSTVWVSGIALAAAPLIFEETLKDLKNYVDQSGVSFGNQSANVETNLTRFTPQPPGFVLFEALTS